MNSEPLNFEQERKLSRYLDRLLEANQRMNLTSVTDRTQAELLHVRDALTLLPRLRAGAFTLADIGSGGGSPAIPIAIARPDVSVTCIESTKKKAAFLQEVAAALDLRNVTVEPVRAESLSTKFGVVTARAVGSLAELTALAMPLLLPGGRLLAMKGPKILQELSDYQKTCARLGGGRPNVYPVALDGTHGRVIVEIIRGRG